MTLPPVIQEAAETELGAAVVRWVATTATIYAAVNGDVELGHQFAFSPMKGIPMATARLEDRGAIDRVTDEWTTDVATTLLLTHRIYEMSAELFGRDEFPEDNPERLAFALAILRVAMVYAAATNDLGSAANAPEDKEGDDDARPTP